MFLKLIVNVGILTLYMDRVVATSCHELQQSQLISLNERMNQMIDTISTLFPKSLKKPTSSAPPPPTPTAEYTPSTTTGQEISYIIPPSAYSSPLPPSQHIMYMPPSYTSIPSPVAVSPPYPSPIGTSVHHYAPEIGLQREYPFSTISSFIPPASVYNYQPEQQQQYANPLVMPNLVSSSYPPVPYSTARPQRSPEYPHPYSFDYSTSTPVYSNVPTHFSSAPLYPLPVQKPPVAYPGLYPQFY